MSVVTCRMLDIISDHFSSRSIHSRPGSRLSTDLSLDKLRGVADACTQADVNGRKASLFTAGCFSDFSESWVLMRLRATVCVFVSLHHMTVTRRLLITATAG